MRYIIDTPFQEIEVTNLSSMGQPLGYMDDDLICVDVGGITLIFEHDIRVIEIRPNKLRRVLFDSEHPYDEPLALPPEPYTRDEFFGH